MPPPATTRSSCCSSAREQGTPERARPTSGPTITPSDGLALPGRSPLRTVRARNDCSRTAWAGERTSPVPRASAGCATTQTDADPVTTRPPPPTTPHDAADRSRHRRRVGAATGTAPHGRRRDLRRSRQLPDLPPPVPPPAPPGPDTPGLLLRNGPRRHPARLGTRHLARSPSTPSSTPPLGSAASKQLTTSSCSTVALPDGERRHQHVTAPTHTGAVDAPPVQSNSRVAETRVDLIGAALAGQAVQDGHRRHALRPIGSAHPDTRLRQVAPTEAADQDSTGVNVGEKFGEH